MLQIIDTPKFGNINIFPYLRGCAHRRTREGIKVYSQKIFFFRSLFLFFLHNDNQMNKTLLLTLAGAGVVLYFLSKGNAAKNLKVNFQNLKFEKPSGFNFPVMLVNFKIINPSSTPLKIDSIVGDLFINGKLFSTVSQQNPVLIPQNNTTVYTVKIETGILQAVTSLLKLLKDRKQLIVKFKGAANSTGLLIPIDQTIIQM